LVFFTVMGLTTSRAMMSGDAFAYGVFERRGAIGPDSYEPHFILSDTESQDNVLKYYDNCQLYKDLVDENDTANIETELYRASIIDGIAARLTLVVTTDLAWNVSSEDVLAFHSICQTQAAMFDTEDEFCTLFLQSELEALEYWEDLDDFYTKSYPYPINYRMTVPLIQDIINAMLAAAEGTSRQVANLRFAHSSTVVPLSSAFGLYDDGFLLHHDTPQSIINTRKFRTSILSPMGTNFAFILYECQQGDQFQIKVLQNEKETIVAGCPTLYCPLDTFVSAYKSYLDADFDDVCQN
jgi:multiple inositol-polyphosphate phosphatase/2,3-bisphosphoglycerate 3-phosphatase